MANTFEEIKNVIVEVLRIDGSDISLETRFIEDLKADSMDQFFLIDGFSEKYNASISENSWRCGKIFRRAPGEGRLR